VRSQAEAGESARRRLALAESALADMQRSLAAAQAERHAAEAAVQRELERRGHPQTARPTSPAQGRVEGTLMLSLVGVCVHVPVQEWLAKDVAATLK